MPDPKPQPLPFTKLAVSYTKINCVTLSVCYLKMLPVLAVFTAYRQ